MTDIEWVIQRWFEAPFPPGHPSSDDLAELKADLAYWDTMVAGDIITFQETGTVRPSVIDNSIGLAELRSRIDAQLPNATGKDRQYINGYLNYIDLLIEAWRAVKSKLDAEG